MFSTRGHVTGATNIDNEIYVQEYRFRLNDQLLGRPTVRNRWPLIGWLTLTRYPFNSGQRLETAGL